MDDRMRHEVDALFARERRTMPAGVRERVLARLEQAGERPGPSLAHRREWLAAAAAVLLAVSVAGVLVTIGTSGRRPQPAGQPAGPPPPPRTAPAGAYDGARGTLVLFGGAANGAMLDETWTWDGRSWTMRHPALSPPARQGALATYDEARHVVLLFGGTSASGVPLADTWTWDGRAWSRHTTATAPPAGGQASMTYDPETRTVLLYTRPAKSGGQGSLWSSNGASWIRLAGEPAPGVSGELLEDWGRVLLVGSSDPTAAARQTWAWQRGAWTLLSPAIALPSLGIAGAAYDRASGRVVVLLDGTGRTETWTWDGVTWTRQHPAHQPPLGPGGWLLSDQRAGGLLWYGRDQTGGGMQTWKWEGRDWTLVVTE